MWPGDQARPADTLSPSPKYQAPKCENDMKIFRKSCQNHVMSHIHVYFLWFLTWFSYCSNFRADLNQKSYLLNMYGYVCSYHFHVLQNLVCPPVHMDIFTTQEFGDHVDAPVGCEDYGPMDESYEALGLLAKQMLAKKIMQE